MQIHVELHCHTVFSQDGLIGVENLVRTAEKVGLDALAVTDHDTIEGAREVQRWITAKSKPLQIILGEEKTLADGRHFIGLFLQEPLQSTLLPDLIHEIHEQGGLCLAPHPFRRKDGVLRNGLEDVALLQKGRVAFELFNGKSSALDNQRARELLPLALAPFVGSDAHYESDLGESLNVMRWEGDLKTSIQRMISGQTPYQLFGRRQAEAEPERAYAPVYYRFKRFVRVPRAVLPAARQAYRWYRNTSRGVGPKPLVELYAHEVKKTA